MRSEEAQEEQERDQEAGPEQGEAMRRFELESCPCSLHATWALPTTNY